MGFNANGKLINWILKLARVIIECVEHENNCMPFIIIHL